MPLTPPDELTAPCAHPDAPEGLRTGGLRDFAMAATRHIVDYAAALDACNADKAAIRAWAESLRRTQEAARGGISWPWN